ncbi:MAG: UDP-N-acetylglucosamine 2-epimerase [Deltaproteobacteria bacterium]|nr:UDP-N-acetylglucosamine 2-epimerase [Deltaproteobacteria bacterium]
MVLVLIGTKAQLIKMAPVMLEMDSQSVPYLFVLTGQHKETMDDLIENFGLRQPDHYLVDIREASTSLGLLAWLSEILQKAVFKLKYESWIKESRLCLVHGDTLSTLIGALIARKFKIPVAHIEAGLRSSNYLNPFPEELIRVMVSKLSSIDYCPGAWAKNNLGNSIRNNKEIINTVENTLLDAVRFAVRHQAHKKISDPYGVVSIHRFENIYNKNRMNFILNQIEDISKSCKLIFVLHPATVQKLHSHNRYHRLKDNPNIALSNRMDFTSFIQMINNSNFLITDGGSNQEESSYLGLPCLLMRKATERKEGLNHNVVLSGYNKAVIQNFIMKNLTMKEKKRESLYSAVSPSEIIVRDIKKRFQPL